MGPNWKGYVLGVVSKLMMIVEGLKWEKGIVDR